MRRNAGILMSAIRYLIQQGLKAGKSEAEIHSPAKRFGREIGAYIPSGVAKDVEKHTPDATKSIKNMVNAMAKAGTAGIDVDIAGKVAMSNSAAANAAKAVAQNEYLKGILAAQQALLHKDWGIKVDGRQLALATNAANANMGAAISKGVFRDKY